MIMGKILKWLKKRPMNKMVILLSIVAAATQAYVGFYALSVANLVVALSWVLIEFKDMALEAKDEAIRFLSGDVEDLMRLLGIHVDQKNYWFFKYRLEELKVDFCKRKIPLSWFLHRMAEYEELIDEYKKSSEKKMEEHDKKHRG